MNDIGAGISTLAVFGFIAFVIWHNSREKLDRRRLRLEEQSRILDRIGGGAELVEFLKSDEGKRFLDALDEPEEPPRSNGFRIGIIGLLTAGLITSMMSVGFFVAARLSQDVLVVPGAVIGGVGVGCLVASWIQHRLGKRWGMLGEESGSARPGRASS